MSFNPDNSTISGSDDASINNPDDNHFLNYDTASQKWTNKQPAIAQVDGLQTSLDAKAPADPVAGLSKVYVAGNDPLPSGLPANTLVVELGSTAIGEVAIGDVTGLQAALDNKLNKKNDTVELIDSTNDMFARVNIPHDGSSAANWKDRLAFYFDGTRSGYFNEYGEIRSRPARSTTIGMRAMSRTDAADDLDAFQVAQTGANNVVFGVSKKYLTTNGLVKRNTYSTVPSDNYLQRTDIGYPIDANSPEVDQVWVDSKKVSWRNEWGALRGRNPYTTWSDSLLRAIIDSGDFVANNGNAIEIVDRRTAPSTISYGRKWTDGSLVRNGNPMADVYVMESGGTPPANLPPGTVIIEKSV